MRISVIGAGAWGTALAIAAARRHRVLLWARDVAQAQQMAAERRNERYLPHAVWPDQLAVTSDHAAALAHAEGGLVVIATPMASAAMDSWMSTCGCVCSSSTCGEFGCSSDRSFR